MHSYLYSCDKCSYVSASSTHLRDHLEAVHEGVIIRCPYEGCPKTFKFRSNIRQHVKHVHENNSIECTECDYTAKSKRALRVHFGLHHGVKYFACEFCDYRAGYQHKMDKHTRNNHRQLLTEKQKIGLKLIKCSKCDYENTKSKIARHELTCNGKENRISELKHICVDCDFRTNHMYKLKHHIKDKHSVTKLSCNECDFTTGHNSNLKSHKLRSHLMFDCNICSYSGRYTAFALHLDTIHKIGSNKGISRVTNISMCKTCGNIPKTKRLFQFHYYWKHNKDNGGKVGVKEAFNLKEQTISRDAKERKRRTGGKVGVKEALNSKEQITRGDKERKGRADKDSASEVDLQCIFCNCKAKVQRFMLHIRRTHGVDVVGKKEKNNEMCQACGKTPPTKARLLVHSYWKHGKLKTEDEETLSDKSKEYFEEEEQPKLFQSIVAVTKESIDKCEYEDISEDEDIVEIKDYFQYLCPLNCCTFALDVDSSVLRIKHLKECHDKTIDIKFLKLLK